LQQRRSLVRISSLFLLTLSAGLAGCRSRFIEVTIVNQGPPVHVMEFDYPSASFGANLLAPDARYHYRFKVQGSGQLSLQYEDASGHTRTAQGPKVDLGDEGSLLVQIDPLGAVTWSASLTNPK
jgi:hypothetical protein